MMQAEREASRPGDELAGPRATGSPAPEDSGQ
jgi:hypothetical protein